MPRLLTLVACAGAVSLSFSTLAKVSPEEASRLGQDLTPAGAKLSGNAEGTIPAWSGKLPNFPQAVYESPGKHLPNPYADEKPLMVLTAANYKEHADKLTAGQITQFE